MSPGQLTAWLTVPALLVAHAISAAAGELRLAPESIDLTRPDQVVEVLVLQRDAPAQREHVVRIWATIPDSGPTGTESDYTYRFRIELASAADGSARIRIAPHPTLAEHGRYLLRVATRDGDQASATVHVRLGPDEALIPPDWIRPGWVLPEGFMLGRRLVLSPDVRPGLELEWTVNRQPQPSPDGALDFVPPRVGVYDLSLVVRSRGREVWTWSGLARVMPEPPLSLRVRAGKPFRLAAPPEFRAVSWSVDGAPVESATILTHSFAAPGLHAVVCTASDPVDPGSPFAFRVITWEVSAVE